MAASGGYPASATHAASAADRVFASGGQQVQTSGHDAPRSGPNQNNHNGAGPSPAAWGYRQGAPPSGNAVNGRSRDFLPAPSTTREPGGMPGAFPKDHVSSTETKRRPSASRMCGKCSSGLQGQFVRALGDTFHLECFTCHDCGKIVASKFFPVPDSGPHQYPLCETDYFRRIDLICHQCGGALRGSYITALERKYHIEHFTCSICPTLFGAQDSYYEHNGNVYCHYHYSTKFAQRCNGCHNSILKQFVEIFRNGQNQHWHPECYMIHKYWNVRLDTGDQPVQDKILSETDAPDEVRRKIRKDEESVEEKVLWIWKTLSQFEERSATCISDMLLHVSNAAYFDGVMSAKKFIVHVDLLFGAADDLDRLLTSRTPKGLSYSREAKLLCKKVVAFFQLLSESSETGVRRFGVTQELLSLVTGLAHYLKLLIRICLQGALKLERETNSMEGLQRFLDRTNLLEQRLEQEGIVNPFADSQRFIHRNADTCPICEKAVEDRCVKAGDHVFHHTCMVCQNCGDRLEQAPATIKWSPSREKLLCRACANQFSDATGGVAEVSRLQQYIHLLKVAHARLLASLRASGALPHTSDDAGLVRYGNKAGTGNSDAANPPLLRSDNRSKSYGGTSNNEPVQPPSSYEQTLGDIRRLRSTRLEKHLSQTMQRARSSRIIDRPEGGSAEPGADGSQATNNLQIVHDKDPNEAVSSVTFGANSLALDDIPRLVAAEQAKDQRPNASKYARGRLIGSLDPGVRLVNGHRRNYSGGDEVPAAGFHGSSKVRYFADLSALEFFNVRHIAVLKLEPLLDNQFSQEELLELIETKRGGFWDRFGFKKQEAKVKGGKKKGVFKQPLDFVTEKEGAESTDGVSPATLRVPVLVHDAITAMRNMDMSVEGVFRKNGNIRRLNVMANDIDANGCDSVDLSKETPVQVAALLKKFLRDLPDPVMTIKLHRLFIAGARCLDDEKRRRILHLTCCLMPKAHRECMEVLFEFLKWAASFHTVDEESGSKMDIHNLATVMAPNILYSSNRMPDTDASFLAIEAVNTMIECNAEMSLVPEDIEMMLGDSSIFSGSAELTTKEILKRYQANEKAPTSNKTPPRHGHGQSHEGSFSKGGRQKAPSIQRIDTDPNMWQNESSVRHVGGPGQGGANVTPTTSTAAGAVGLHGFDVPQAPYAQERNGSRDSVNGTGAGAGGIGNGGSPRRSSLRGSGLSQKGMGGQGITG